MSLVPTLNSIWATYETYNAEQQRLNVMGMGRKRSVLKMKRRKSQAQKKRALKKRIEASKK